MRRVALMAKMRHDVRAFVINAMPIDERLRDVHLKMCAKNLGAKALDDMASLVSAGTIRVTVLGV